MPQPTSLRVQLLSRIIVPLLLMLVVVSVGGYSIIHRPTIEAYDQLLADAALAVSRQVELVGSGGGKPPHLKAELSRGVEQVLRTDRYDSIYFLVLDGQGRFVAGDAGLPPPALIGERVFYDTLYRNHPVRATAMTFAVDEQPVTVIVAETTNKRELLVWHIGLGLLAPELLLAAGLVGIVWYGVARALEPLERLREQLQARSHLDLSPLDEGPAVEEVRPLVREINELLRRLGLASLAQQRFIANAAHQLRTPLAGLQTQLELTLTETDPAERQARLERCRHATGRTARLVNQLLALSAAEARGRDDREPLDLDLAQVLRERADAWVHQAIGREIDFGLELVKAPVRGDALLIGEMASNLVDNALAYTAAGGSVTLSCGVAAEGAYLEMVDNGPGIPAEARERVVERFFRLPGSPGGGSGLGLAIVQEIAQHHGARVFIQEAPGGGSGTLVTVRFPRFRALKT